MALRGDGTGGAVAGALTAIPVLADLLGERHRIIANDWQAAAGRRCGTSGSARARARSPVDFSPAALREDLAGERTGAAYLYSASELSTARRT